MKSVANMRYSHCFVICLLLALGGCSKKGDVTVSPANFVPDGVTDTSVTYTNYVHNVIKNNCSTCHGKGGSAFQFWYNTNTYENAVVYGTRIMETIVENSMPPAPRKPFSDADKQLLKAWIKRGSPE
jgi:uncharacterized membrane protein